MEFQKKMIANEVKNKKPTRKVGLFCWKVVIYRVLTKRGSQLFDLLCKKKNLLDLFLQETIYLVLSNKNPTSSIFEMVARF